VFASPEDDNHDKMLKCNIFIAKSLSLLADTFRLTTIFHFAGFFREFVLHKTPKSTKALFMRNFIICWK
jgi:hypothetical protein